MNKEIFPECEVILALDLSLTASGWAKYEVGSKETTTGLIDTHSFRGMERVDYIREKVEMKVGDKSRVETAVLIENFAYGAKGNAVYELGMMQGVVRHMLYKAGVKYLVIVPQHIKMFAADKGNVKKDVIIKEVYRRWGLDTDDDNVADAFVLLQIGKALAGCYESPLTQFQQKAIDKITLGVS